MKISVYLLGAITSIVSFSVFTAENIGPDDNQLLLASCQSLTTLPEQEKAKPCIFFIRGFLAAAQAIDPPVNIQQTKKKPKFYGLMSRTYIRKAQIPPARFFPFCVPDNESETRVIKLVSKQLASQKADTAELLRDMIFKALKSEYPCKKV